MNIKSVKNLYKILWMECNLLFYLFNRFYDIVISVYVFLFNCICILDSDIRRDVFIGVTGLMVAIVIFIAEMISNKKNELEKKLILSITKIKGNIIFCIVIFFLLYMGTLVHNTIAIKELDGVIYNDFLYFCMQLGINICIILFMCITVKTFLISVKLNTDKDFFNTELEKFLEERASTVEKKATKKGIKDINQLKKEYDDFINSSSRLSKEYLASAISDELYVPIYPNKNGVIKKYDYYKINAILNSIEQKNSLEISEYQTNDKVYIYFIKGVGEKINKQEPIAYCMKELFNQCNEMSYAVDYYKNVIYIDDEIKVINDDLCKIAMTFNEPDAFDSNGLLFNYFNYLYKNNLIGIKSLILEQLYDTAKRLYKNDYKNKSLCRFLNRISHLAFENDNYEDYDFINHLIHMLYFERLDNKDNYNKDDDIKDLAFEYVTSYFIFNYYSVSKNYDIRYCDNLTSYLFRFVSYLIKNKNFDAVKIVFNNISFTNKDINEQDLSEMDILNFQFVSGIIFCMYLTYKKKPFDEKEVLLIKEIIKWLQYNLFGFYDAWHIVSCFKKYFEKSSCIQKAYDDFNHNFDEHKHKRFWSGGYIDNKLILKEILVAFDISFAFDGDVNYDEISKDDLNYYQSLKTILLDNTSSCFANMFNSNYKNNEIIKIIDLVIDDAHKKEEKYLEENALSINKVEELKSNIINSINENDALIEYLNEISKVENEDFKLKIVYGINEFIPRDFFFDDCYELDDVARDLGKTVKRGVTNKYIEKIKSISKIEEKNINDVINGIDNIDDYILISDCIHYREIENYDLKTNTIINNEKQVKAFRIPKVNAFYLISKENLPILEYCDFEDIYSKENIQESIYYEFSDCSQNEELRNSMIEANKWLSEKGSIDDQHSYLKKQCRLKVFLSFKVRKVKNSSAIQVNYKEK